MDSSLLHYVIQLRRPWLDDVMLLASALGGAGFIWWITALITMVFPNKRAAAWRVILVVLITQSVSDFVLKPIVDRPRPFVVDSSVTVIDAKSTNGSFPSGHAATAVAGAIAVSRMLPGSGWVCWPLALLIGISRVYIGMHWPTDVLAGAILGLGLAWFVLCGKGTSTRDSVISAPLKTTSALS